MAAEQALVELLEVSEDVYAAVVFDREGEILAASVGEEAAREAADRARAMLAYADSLRNGAAAERIQSVSTGGGVFVVRSGDRAVVAATGADPAAGLVLHDLRATLAKAGKKPRARASAS